MNALYLYFKWKKISVLIYYIDIIWLNLLCSLKLKFLTCLKGLGGGWRRRSEAGGGSGGGWLDCSFDSLEVRLRRNGEFPLDWIRESADGGGAGGSGSWLLGKNTRSYRLLVWILFVCGVDGGVKNASTGLSLKNHCKIMFLILWNFIINNILNFYNINK